MGWERASVQSKQAEVNFSPDLIRVIAIALVILVHCSGFPYAIQGEITPTVVMDWFTADVYSAFGYLGVPLFVMLSGALLLEPTKADEPMRVFFKKRFNRIAFPMMFWTVAYFAWGYYVHGRPLTLFNISQGLLTGSYDHLWFLYLLLGLYLVTPILRVLVKFIDRRKFVLLLSLWFVGTVVTPTIHTFTTLTFNPVVFVFMDWVGYFLLGLFLVQTKIRSWIIYLAAISGILIAVVGDWLITATLGETYTGFFHGYVSFDIIIASAALFILLITIPPRRVETRYNSVNRVIHWIGQNTLPIYLIHIMVLESLALGFFGFTLPYVSNSIVRIPMTALVTFLLSAAIVYPLMKIPYVKRLIG
jgi:surface polysaccharide O-acyltransferase-like enzyme